MDSKSFTGSEDIKELRQKEPSQRVMKQKKQTPAAQEPHDDDDEFGGDDILGLIDTPQKPTGGKKPSRFDELLGRKQPQEDKQQSKKEELSSLNTEHNSLLSNTENITGTTTVAQDGEHSKTPSSDFQFGGYLPSSMSSSVSSRKSRGLPQGRRKGLSDTVITERPSTAPGKKSVRFSDTVDSSNDTLRPSSVPAVRGHVKQEDTNQNHPTDKGSTVNLKDIQLEPKTSTTANASVKEKSITIQQSDESSTQSSRLLPSTWLNLFYFLFICSVFGMNDDDLLVERPPTGSRRRRDVTLPLDQQSLSLFESSESTVLLPSRERSTPNKAHPLATPTIHQDALQPIVKHNETLSTVSTNVPTNIAVYSAIPPDTALQQQLTQQQLLMQQQSLQLQQLSSELATSKMQLVQARSEGENSTKEKINLLNNQLKCLQEQLQEEKSMSSKLKVYLCGYFM